MGKTFWQRPEGVTGGIFLAGIIFVTGMLLTTALPVLIAMAQNTLYLAGMLGVLGALIFVALDPKTRNLVWYAYKSVMRWITGLFVQIDPISVLKSYIEDLEDNLRKLSKQIGALRGQMRQLKGTMDGNQDEIGKNMILADQARKKNDEKNMALAARKAGRLQDANAKYEVLYKKMEVLYRMLTKMYENSEIIIEDTKDSVKVKEQEYLAIQAGHSAIRSAMNILTGDPDKRALFDQAVEAMAEEVSAKVGEMERFMDTSRHLMDTIDLQNGVLEEEGMLMLERWEKESPFFADVKNAKKGPETSTPPALDLNKPPKTMLKEERNDYHSLFE